MKENYIKFKLKDLPGLLKITFQSWNSKDPFRQSAVIAYYSIFSIPGLLVLIIAITGFFFGKEAVNQQIHNQITGTMGNQTADQINTMLVNASRSHSTLFGTVIGVIVLLVGATGVFVELQKSLNQIWKVKTVTQKGILILLKTRLFSFGLIMAIAFLLLISLVISTALATFSEWISNAGSELLVFAFSLFNILFSLVVISVLFALMFKILPDAKIKWKHVWLGAVITGFLFTIGKTALALYFGKAHPDSIYGAAGSIILILLWVSYSSMILFFGAEFTSAFATKYSGQVPPTEIASKTSAGEVSAS